MKRFLYSIDTILFADETVLRLKQHIRSLIPNEVEMLEHETASP